LSSFNGFNPLWRLGTLNAPAKPRFACVTQNQALSAILFLYRDVLGQELEWIEGFERAKRPARLPVVLTPAETRAVLAQLEGTKWLMQACSTVRACA